VQSISRRKQLSGTARLNSIIEGIVDRLMDLDPNFIFVYRVDKKIAPNYYQKIRQPICLDDMKSRSKRQEYSSIDVFKDDLALLR